MSARIATIIERVYADRRAEHIEPLGTHALRGEVWSTAFPYLREAVGPAQAMQILFSHSVEAAWLSEAYLLAGNVNDAKAVALQALQLARERKERGYEARILYLHAEIFSSSQHASDDVATRYYEEAMALATQLNMRPLVAHCHTGLSERCAARGDMSSAHQHRDTADDLYRAMGMGPQSKLEELAPARRHSDWTEGCRPSLANSYPRLRRKYRSMF